MSSECFGEEWEPKHVTAWLKETQMKYTMKTKVNSQFPCRALGRGLIVGCGCAAV